LIERSPPEPSIPSVVDRILRLPLVLCDFIRLNARGCFLLRYQNVLMLFACSGLPSRRRVMRITDDMFVHHLTVGDPRHIRKVWLSLRFLPVNDSVWAMVQVPPRSNTRPSLEARILDYCQRSGWTVTELSKSLSAPESTILAILRAYEPEGHVRVSCQGVWTVVKTKKT
jgi:hypothetical protein